MEKENPVKSRWLTVLLLEPVSFSGIARDLKEVKSDLHFVP